MATDSFRPTGRGSILTDEGLTLYTQHWTPEANAQATVLLVHGYGEHCGRYDHVAETFVRRGAAVYAYDQRGHGRSEGRRAYVDRYEHFLSDLAHFHEHVTTRRPDRPVFLFGHSMGGLFALLYVLNETPDLRGLILSAPAIEINPDLAPLLRRLARLLGRLAPTLPTVRSPQDAISRDPAVVEEAKNDPLNYNGRVLARTGAELLRAGEKAQSRLHELEVPVLVVHGSADPLATPAWSKRLVQRAATDDKTLELYEGLYHETFNEPEQDQVLEDLGTWLADRIPTDPSSGQDQT